MHASAQNFQSKNFMCAKERKKRKSVVKGASKKNAASIWTLSKTVLKHCTYSNILEYNITLI